MELRGNNFIQYEVLLITLGRKEFTHSGGFRYNFHTF